MLGMGSLTCNNVFSEMKSKTFNHNTNLHPRRGQNMPVTRNFPHSQFKEYLHY